jgi:3-oxoacyl-[acyl-carrier-protein] synthase II
MRTVVVTGVGAITPCGPDLESSWQAISRGQSGVARITRFDASAYASRIAGEVKPAKPTRVATRKRQPAGDLFIQYALAAADMCLAAAKFEPTEEEKDRTGTILGVGLGGMAIIERTLRTLDEKGPGKISPYVIPAVIGNLAAGQISMRYGLRGASYTTTSACASGAHAIGQAYRAIQFGEIDACVAGGSESAITTLSVAGFSRMHALSTRNEAPERASRPFDRDHDGFVIAEGAAILLLEEREHALARGALILAEIRGYGSTADAHHITQPAVGGDGGRRAMQMALQEAKMDPTDIHYINAHATSTSMGDKAELLALRRVFGESLPDIPISSTKSMTGHMLGAAGALEAIFCILALREQLLPPTINLEHPIEEAAGLDLVPNVARPHRMKTAMSNSFGFGGANVSLVLQASSAAPSAGSYLS